MTIFISYIKMKLFLSFLCLSQVFAMDRDWWKHLTMYEIVTPSYKDSNGDGWGDLKGIASKLDYLQNLGVDTLYLTPYHPSPLLDMGYDVADYFAIHPSFGTMADFHELMRQLKKRDMKLIMDLIINHSSDQHEWFKKSVDKIYPYTDYYVWRDPKGYHNASSPIEPNNWCNFLFSPGWTWNDKRKQFYYHAFLPQQPDLNYRNPRVMNEMKKIIKYWLNKGVAGIRIDAVPYIMEDPLFEDQESINESSQKEKVECHLQKRTKTQNIADTFDFIHQIRSYVDELTDSLKANTLERIVILETFCTKEEMKAYHGNASYPMGHYAFHYFFEFQFDYLNLSAINMIIDDWMDVTPNNSAPNWLLGCHDRFRGSFKFIQEYVNVMFTLISTLPGIMSVYYGEEIGMTSGVIRPNQRLYFSEYARTPMQWDGTSSGGFSSNATTWLPVNPNYWRLNVKNDQSDPKSVYNFIKSLLTLRKTESMMYGDFQKFILTDWIFVIKRSFGKQNNIVVLNLGTEREKVILDHLPNMSSVSVLKVYLSTPNSGFKKGTLVAKKKKRSFIMKPMSAVVLSQEK